jgi:16S rRNA G966 N2-methylase RsmD
MSKNEIASMDASKVEELHRLANENASNAVQFAIACGLELQRMKAQLGHGQFGQWCKGLSFSPATARAYMQAAKTAPQIASTAGNLSLRGLLAASKAQTKQAAEDKQKADLARPIDIELPAGLHRGDFRELSESIPDESVALVFTDPPYDGESVPLYEDAARIAARILKPGGSLIAYSGQRHLPDVLAGMSKHMRYWWTIAGVHDGGNQILQKLGIRCGWKPLVWFVKDTRGDVQNVMLDIVRGDREKDAHIWQQSQAEAEHIIGRLCPEGGTVVDFFLGGGTTAAACQKLGRKFIGFEINAASMERSAERLAA